MLIGAHVSASGGLWNGPENAAALGLETFQFFSRPPQGGRVGPITPETAKKFRTSCDTHGFEKYYIHTPYVINLASKEERIRNNTVEVVRGELDRGTALGATAVMFHPGSASGVGEEAGLKMVIDGIAKILNGYKGSTRLLVEISAGAGMVIADSFEEVAAIMDGVQHEMLGVCFDTAHAFASGYDLRNEKALAATMKKFDDAIGLEKLELSHCNDSKVDIGERRDRHEHLGKGFIGKTGFEAIMASKAFKNVNLILETEPEGVAADIKLLKKLRG
ncbi:MAG: hypothetical protein RLZZ324_1353 [Candidatus Parcubacteria bacterium]|jgi:deoxyribonuclease-4